MIQCLTFYQKNGKDNLEDLKEFINKHKIQLDVIKQTHLK